MFSNVIIIPITNSIELVQLVQGTLCRAYLYFHRITASPRPETRLACSSTWPATSPHWTMSLSATISISSKKTEQHLRWFLTDSLNFLRPCWALPYPQSSHYPFSFPLLFFLQPRPVFALFRAVSRHSWLSFYDWISSTDLNFAVISSWGLSIFHWNCC